jgi:AraC-like DNA-binding protein
MQLVLIRRGVGRFESRATAERRVGRGDVLVLPPRSWHRYRPDEATGWEELWIELEGPVVDRLITAGLLSADARVVPSHRPAELEQLLRAIHSMVFEIKTASNEAERGALGLQALALVAGETDAKGASAHRATWVREAEHRMAANLRDAPRAQVLARELGVSYSHFRREFRRVTGMAPHRYLARLRLDRARRLLGSSGVGLDQLADRLGYSSAFHLSAAFKQEFGVSPKTWRALAARETGAG